MPRPLDAKRAVPNPDAPRFSPLDGFPRTADEDAKITSAVFHTFTTAPGEATLKWLREIATEAVIQSTDPDSVLRHMEGQRHLVKLIEMRIKLARS